MDTETPNPPILPQTEASPPVNAPVEPPPVIQQPVSAPPKPSWLPNLDRKTIVITIAVVVVVIVVTWLVQANKAAPAASTTAPTATPTATPTLPPSLSPFATGSAFMKFETDVTNLPTTIQNAVLLDQTLSPPQLTLPLGFSN